jgi:hypothetical protein
VLDVERRGDGLADQGQRPQLVDGARELGRALLEFFKQPRMFNGDDCLVGKRFE